MDTVTLRHASATLVNVLFAGFTLMSAPGQTTGFVYIASNQVTGNSVIQFRRNADGSLTQITEVSTGGLGGTGNGVGALDPLGSQDSLVLAGAGSLILVVNAGSNQLSSLTVDKNGLHLMSTVSSNGTFPNSLASNGDLVYVLNAQGTPNVSGFRVDSSGVLHPINNSTRNLPGGTGAAPHDVRFSPDGTRLIVTEGGTNKIDIFELGGSGLITGGSTQSSAGSGPFGFKFGRAGVLANAEANTSSVSTYFLTSQNTLTLVSSTVPDTEMASCWITLTADGKFAFISNTASGTLSSYAISGNGTLNLETAVAASLTQGAPIDSALSHDGSFLYVIDSAMGRVFFFKVHGASLAPLGYLAGLPLTIQGIAAQ